MPLFLIQANEQLDCPKMKSSSGEDPLEEKGMTILSFLPGEIPWTEEPCSLQSMGSQRGSQTQLKHAFHKETEILLEEEL